MVAALLRSKVAAGRPGLTLPLASLVRCWDLFSLLPGLGGDLSPGVSGGVTMFRWLLAFRWLCVAAIGAGDESNSGGGDIDTCR